MSICIDDLKAEIEFWQGLIKEWKLSETAPEYQRMKQALQLSRSKLMDQEFQHASTIISKASHWSKH